MKNKASALRAINCNSLLSVNADAKTIKGKKMGFLTGVLYMSPADIAYKALGLKGTLCASSGAAKCAAGCLYEAGLIQVYKGIRPARLARAQAFILQKQAFFTALYFEIQALERRAKREQLIPAVRLNGTSDINYLNEPFQGPNGLTATVFDHFPHIKFYDYTKNNFLAARKLPANYSLTFSYSEASAVYAQKAYNAAILAKTGLAVVFRKHLPAVYKGLRVINGDETDLRFIDNAPGPYIVGLKAKGPAKHDYSGFVVDLAA